MRAKITEALALAAGAAAANGAALVGSTILGVAPWAHADDLSTEICGMLVDDNAWSVTHTLARRHHVSIAATMVPAAYAAVDSRCPALAWRLPTPSAPAPLRQPILAPTTPAPEHDYYGDEPWPIGEEFD